MKYDVGVVVGTFGDQSIWGPMADRAIESVEAQTVPTIWVVSHKETLASARNAGADELGYFGVKHLIFLDADDRLDEHYVESMLSAEGNVIQPSTRGFYDDGRIDASANVIPPGRNLLERNHLVVGSMVDASMFESVGRFRELRVLEDWDLWIRCWLAGAVFGVCPEAVYWVGVREGSRNHNEIAGKVAQDIRSTYMLRAKKEGLL